MIKKFFITKFGHARASLVTRPAKLTTATTTTTTTTATSTATRNARQDDQQQVSHLCTAATATPLERSRTSRHSRTLTVCVRYTRQQPVRAFDHPVSWHNTITLLDAVFPIPLRTTCKFCNVKKECFQKQTVQTKTSWSNVQVLPIWYAQ